MEPLTTGNCIILAMEAIQSSPKMSQRRAAKLYNIPRATLGYRMKGRVSLAETGPGSQLLTEIEEESIVEYVLSQDA